MIGLTKGISQSKILVDLTPDLSDTDQLGHGLAGLLSLKAIVNMLSFPRLVND